MWALGQLTMGARQAKNAPLRWRCTPDYYFKVPQKLYLQWSQVGFKSFLSPGIPPELFYGESPKYQFFFVLPSSETLQHPTSVMHIFVTNIANTPWHLPSSGDGNHPGGPTSERPKARSGESSLAKFAIHRPPSLAQTMPFDQNYRQIATWRPEYHIPYTILLREMCWPDERYEDNECSIKNSNKLQSF